MFIFKTPQEINLENLSELNEIQLEQLRQSMELYFGEKLENVVDWFYPNEPEGLVVCNFFQIADDNEQNIYDFWNLEADSGTVFKAGTTEQTGIEMIQFYFEVTISQPKDEVNSLKEITGRLQEAFKNYFQNES